MSGEQPSSSNNSNSSTPSNNSDRRRSSFVDIFGRPVMAPNFGPRRLSVSTVGLSGSMPNNQGSPFGSARGRTGSMSSANSGSVDESPFEDEGPPVSSMPTTPFARRMSFGAKALRDARNGSSGNTNGGFDFAEAIRARAERSSVSGSSTQQPPQAPHHHRSKSTANMERPIREMPKQSKAPDAYQERILKGDFYMD